MSHNSTTTSSSNPAKAYKTGSNHLSHLRYEIDNELQIVNSINYFKGEIEPSWEDKANENCGALVFQIERAQENYQ